MTALSKVERDLKPPRTFVLPPSAFADDWPGKPTAEVAVGLRYISQRDLDVARREAERVVVGFYDELRGLPRAYDPEVLDDVRNDEFVMNAVARATCSPNDVTQPYFKAAEDTVRVALTAEGARRIWDEYVILAVGNSVTRPRASDAQVERLGRALANGAHGRLTDEARLLLGYLAESLELAEDEPEDETDDDAETVHLARSA